jgi:hypothetical protein
MIPANKLSSQTFQALRKEDIAGSVQKVFPGRPGQPPYFVPEMTCFGDSSLP